MDDKYKSIPKAGALNAPRPDVSADDPEVQAISAPDDQDEGFDFVFTEDDDGQITMQCRGLDPEQGCREIGRYKADALSSGIQSHAGSRAFVVLENTKTGEIIADRQDHFSQTIGGDDSPYDRVRFFESQTAAADYISRRQKATGQST